MRVVPLLEALPELLEPLLRLRAHRPREVAEGLRVGEVDLLAGVVGQDPGEDGVLHQVVVGPPGERVERHQVLEVGNLAADPPLRHRRLACVTGRA